MYFIRMNGNPWNICCYEWRKVNLKKKINLNVFKSAPAVMAKTFMVCHLCRSIIIDIDLCLWNIPCLLSFDIALHTDFCSFKKIRKKRTNHLSTCVPPRPLPCSRIQLLLVADNLTLLRWWTLSTSYQMTSASPLSTALRPFACFPRRRRCMPTTCHVRLGTSLTSLSSWAGRSS